MPHDSAKFPIAVVSACMSSDGTPTFTLYEVQVTRHDYVNGVHYSLVETYLADDGFDEPYVHEHSPSPFPLLHSHEIL
jgi:hypothetical protein